MLRLSNFLFLVIFFSISFHGHAISVNNAPVGENRVHFTKDNILINIRASKGSDIKAIVDEHSFEWVRAEEILLIPRVRLKIKIADADPSYHLKYKDITRSFQQSSKSSYAELIYSLFERDNVEIFKNNKIIGSIDISFKNHKKEKLIIDYTCSRNAIKVKGLENEHFSIGCLTRRIGGFGNEKAMLEIKWISPELKILNSNYVPYEAAFTDKKPIYIQVLNIKTKKIKTITLTAKIPKRLHRMFTAYGFGPYALHTKIESATSDPTNKTTQQIHTPIAPALFFYLNYKISDSTSIRGFDAAIFQESKFNNAGLYLGSDFGFALDNKLYFTTLLGVQYLYFQYNADSTVISEPIFPQGIEFMYRHAFDIPNYIISGGIFLSTDKDIEYENIWVRWGKNYFWELNLISWAKADFEAKTWGLSVGFPFKGFL